MIQSADIEFNNLPEEAADELLGEYSDAACRKSSLFFKFYTEQPIGQQVVGQIANEAESTAAVLLGQQAVGRFQQQVVAQKQPKPILSHSEGKDLVLNFEKNAIGCL